MRWCGRGIWPTIRNTFEDRETLARLNGKPAIAIEVSKRAGANLIATVDAVKAEANAFQAELPQGVEITFSQDKSTDIRTLLADLQNSVLTAVLLVFMVILFYLGFRSSLLIGLAIPTSFLMGIMFLSIAGYTVNIVVLFSLILAVGMLVDDAIIVTEYAERRMAEGVAAPPAFAEAARRMFGPVVVSTLTRIAAFSPLLFWPGIVGEFMSYMPITLIATLSASTIYALLFAPTIGSIVGKAAVQKRKPDGFYMAVIKKAVRYPILTILLVAALMGGVVTTYMQNNNGVEFFPSVEPEYGLLYVKARATFRWRSRTIWSGAPRSGCCHGPVSRPSTPVSDRAAAACNLGPAVQRTRSARSSTNSSTGASASRPAIFSPICAHSSPMWRASTSRSRRPMPDRHRAVPIQVRLSADDPTGLEEAAANVGAYLDTLPEIIDPDTGLPPLSIDWELKVDRTEAAKFGLGPDWSAVWCSS
ncbi:MAG: efflux RND transporter permease subunit [Hyphomicrobiales bacterium]